MAIPRLLLPLSLAACNPGGAFQGKVVDGLSQSPRGDEQVLARARDSSDLGCQVREASTDAQGNFLIEGLCAGTRYDLSLGNKTLQLDHAVTLSGDEISGESTEIRSWRVPLGSGVHKLAMDRTQNIRTFADVAAVRLPGSDQDLRFLTVQPGAVDVVKKGEHLILAGKELSGQLEFLPLVTDAGTRSFEGDRSLTDAPFLGVGFEADGSAVPVTAQLDQGRVIVLDNGQTHALLIPSDALPQGRYALVGKKDKRAFILDFGEELGADVAAAPMD